MSLKTFAKMLPPIVINVANYAIGRNQQRTNKQMLQEYLQNGKVPWSVGYDIYKSDQTLRLRIVLLPASG